MTRPVHNLCTVCHVIPEAIANTGYCFGCWPGGPVIPPPCLVCGSLDYYNTGKCRRCHLYGQPGVEACRCCLAWGTTRKWKWLCRACHSWNEANPAQAACRICSTVTHLHREHCVCRLCFAQARNMTPVLGRFDLDEANRHGQQLFFAELTWQKGSSRKARQAELRARTDTFAISPRMTKRHKMLLEPPLPSPGTLDDYTISSRYEHRPLFRAERDYTRLRQKDFPWPADSRLLLQLWKLTDERTSRLGWSAPVRMRCRAGLRIVLGLQDTPGAPVPLTSLEFLADINLTSKHVAAVLDEAGLLVDDRESTLERWIETRLTGLPPQMINEVRIWFDVMVNGRSKPPRRRPRNPVTIRLHFSWALPALTAWAAAGHTTLRTITRETVAAVLTDAEHPSRTGQGLRSMFQLLKQDHVLFADPTYRMRIPYHPTREPLLVETAAIKALLDTSNPARAAVAALVAFHALHTGQVCDLKLIDISAGWLHIDGRKIPLAEPVRERITAYLDYRTTTWPRTANPHLFVNRRSAMELRAVGRRWIKLLLGPGVSCRSIREDRILAEALASRGDARRLQDMFGLSIAASLRYTSVLDHPGFTEGA